MDIRYFTFMFPNLDNSFCDKIMDKKPAIRASNCNQGAKSIEFAASGRCTAAIQ
jgi:hypothetical protein